MKNNKEEVKNQVQSRDKKVKKIIPTKIIDREKLVCPHCESNSMEFKYRWIDVPEHLGKLYIIACSVCLKIVGSNFSQNAK